MPLLTHFKAGLHGSQSSGRLLLLQLVKNYVVTYKTQRSLPEIPLTFVLSQIRDLRTLTSCLVQFHFHIIPI